MAMFVNGRRVITNAPGAVVRSVSENYTSTWHRGKAKFENICKSEDLVDCCDDVKVDGYAVATIKSYFPQSYGDEKGIGGGVKSGTINGKGVFITASPNVFVSSLDGSIVNQPIVREGDLVVSNNGNCEPAPIEYLPAYQIDTPCKAPPLEEKPDEGDEKLWVVVHGKNQPFYGHLVPHCKQTYTHVKAKLATDIDEKDTDGLAKRLTFTGLKEGQYAWGFYQETHNGGRIAISFLEDIHPTWPNQSKPGKISEEDTQIVMLRPVMQYQLPKQPLTNADKKDFSDIFRLSNHLRARVYHVLMLNKLTPQAALFLDENKDTIALDDIDWADTVDSMQTFEEMEGNWYELLPESLQTAVDEELSTKIIDTLPDGYLYIFLDGHIWREIHIDEGDLHEVDLRRFGGIQARPTMGDEQQNLMVPYKIGGREVKVEIAFSEEQWSWSRVRFYGGLAQDDERRVDKEDPFTQDVNLCEERRKNRFTTLNLKSLIEDKQTEVLDQKGAKHLFQEFDIYHCVIPAPTIPISRAINDILMLQQELIQVTENTQNPVHENHGSTAMLVYKYFFDEKSGLLSKQKTTKDIQSIESDRINSDNLISFSTGLQPSVAALNRHANKPTDASQNDDIRTIIDLDKVKASLKSDRRTRLRELIRLTQNSLISLLQQTHSPITDIKPSLIAECDIDWYQCVKDYLCSNLNAYGKGFNFIGTLTNALAFEPSDIDAEMDLKRDIDADQPTAGHIFIVKLIEKGSPLSHLLYPSEQDISDAKELRDIEVSETFKKNFPNYQLPEIEKFNIYFFKYISNNGISVSKDISDLFNSIIKNIASNYQESIERKLLLEGKNAIEQSIKKSVVLFKSYLDIIQNKLMPDFEMKYLSEITSEDAIIGTSHQQLEGQSISIAEHQAATNQKSEIFHDDNGEILGAKVSKEFNHPQGVEVDETIHFNEAQPLAKAHLENYLTKKKLNLSEKPKHDPLVITAKEEAYKSTSIFKKQPIHLMDIGSSSALLFLGLLNVKSKVDALKKEIKEDNSSSLQAKLEAIEASLSTSYLLENVARSLFEQKRVDEWYMSQHKLIEKGMDFSVRQGFAFTPLSLIGTFASSISIGLTLRNIYLGYLEYKPEQLTSHYLQLGINIGTTLSFIGTAAERALDKAVSTKLAEYAEKEMLRKFSQSILKKMALDEVLEATTWGFARKTLIRFSMPFANSYVGLLLIIGTLAFDLYADVCKERALKSWVKSTPFSLVKVDSSPKDEGELLAEFANVMTQPKAEFGKKQLSKGKVQYFIDFTLPRFDPNHHQLQLCIYSNRFTFHMGETYGGMTISKTRLVREDSEFHVPYAQECIFDKDVHLTKVRIYLDPNTDWFHAHAVQTKFSCQFRVILNDGVSLPLEKYHGKYIYQHNLRGSDESHAYHVEPIVIIGRGQEKIPIYLKDDEQLEGFLEKHSMDVKLSSDLIT